MNQLRASFPERDAYLDRLAQHYADGLLDDAGFEARRIQLLQATSHGEMLRAFDGLPRPRYLQGEPPVRNRNVGRRWLLVAGAAVVGVAGIGVLGAASWLGPGPDHVTEASPLYNDDPLGDSILFTGEVEETIIQLQERGLTLIGEFSVTPEDGISGTAISPRAPGELRTFQRRPQRTLIVAEGVEGETPPTVEIERLHTLIYDVVYRVGDDLGVPEAHADGIRLVFTERGNPSLDIDVVDPDRSPLGTMRYDLDGNLMAVEENP